MFFFKLLFTSFKNKKLYVNNFGNHYRDFTYIKDVINILIKLMRVKLSKKYQVLNICSSRPIYLKKFIKISEKFSAGGADPLKSFQKS